jgi:micrococcal nuclease
MLTRLLKTPWQQCPGVFLWLLVCAGSMFVEIAVAENHINCSAQHITWHQLASVIDGDTLRLDDGRKVRVLSINTPELVHDVSEAQPLAVEARQAAIEFFKNGDRVGLSLGVDSLDRYGRLLAQVYREDGANLSAYMLAQGLGWQVVVPPNDVNWQCLRQHEDDARKQQLGVWQKGIFPVKKADQLRIQDSGFQRVEGVVSSVNQVLRHGLS